MDQITVKFSKGKIKIGKDQPVFVVAEISGNHNKSLARAKKIIDAAKAAGVDAIKLQTYTPDTLTIDSNNKYFRVKTNNDWKGQTLYQLYKKAYTPWSWQLKLKQYAEKRGMVLFSTPFDPSAVDFLEKMNIPLYKVASFEIGDIPLLERIGKTKKPVIISRGLASGLDIKLAIKTLKKNGCPQLAVLHCVSSYPAEIEQMNLATIPDIIKKYKVVSGLSDHSLGNIASVAATALGASIIEKHITLKRSDGGPDSSFSLEPNEFKEMVDLIRKVSLAIGKPTYKVDKKESQSVIFKKSIFVISDITKGELFNKKNVRVIRPGNGLAPKHYKSVLGKRAVCNIDKGTPLIRKLIKK